ncbi:MAG TPA: glycosyltransferase family 39 protein [Planktothrix sp.]
MIRWRKHVAILLCICFGLYFFRLGNFGVIDNYYPQAAREMLEAHDWFVPHLNYQLYFSKPIMTFGLIEAAYAMFGVSELTGRLMNAVFATLLVMICYFTARTVFNARTGLISGIILASAPLLVGTSRSNSIDTFLAFFWGSATCAFIITVCSQRTKWWPAIYLALAACALTKGPAPAGLFGIAILLFMLCARASKSELWQWIKTLKPVQGLALFTALVLPWYIAIAIATKGLFLKIFFLFENISRLHGGLAKRQYPFLYALPLAYGTLPWSLFLPSAFWRAIKPFVQRQSAVGETSGTRQQQLALLFCACCVVTLVGFFSCARFELDVYILPAWTAIAILLGAALNHWLESAEEGASVARPLKFVSVIMLALGVAIAPVALYEAVKAPWPELWMRVAISISGLVLAASWITQYWLLRKQRLWKALAFSLVGTSLGYTLLVPPLGETYWRINFADTQKLASMVADTDAQVAQYHRWNLTLLYYRHGPMEFFYNLENLLPAKNCPQKILEKVHRPLYVIVEQLYEPQLTSRPGTNFKKVATSGIYDLLVSQDAVLIPSDTTEEVFRKQPWKMIVTADYPINLAMPWGGGSYPEKVDLTKK